MEQGEQIIFKNSVILDTVEGVVRPDRHVLVEGGRIKEVGDKAFSSRNARIIDVAGRVLMPGLCDGHVHVTTTTADFGAVARWSPTYATARAAMILRDMLMRGFTTVRDAGGADYGLAAAVEEGYLVGPRILFCGHALSQTGGHGDVRHRGENSLEDSFGCASVGRICDGVAEVRRAARDEIRKGASHIKLMASGGVVSPTDRISSAQFSEEEITAAVEEAEAAGLYVMAHAIPARAIKHALRCGVRSIEHGHLMDEECVDLLLEKDAFFVPTISTIQTLWNEGLAAGLPKTQHAKIGEVLEASKKVLELTHRRGVKIVYGTDLLGELHRHQSFELSLRSKFQRPAELIRSATVTAAELFQMSGEIGVIVPGARADILVVDGNPLEDVHLLEGQGRHLRVIMKDGVLYKNETA